MRVAISRIDARGVKRSGRNSGAELDDTDESETEDPPTEESVAGENNGENEKRVTRGSPYNTKDMSSPDKGDCTEASTNLVDTSDNPRDEVDRATRRSSTNKRVEKMIHEQKKTSSRTHRPKKRRRPLIGTLPWRLHKYKVGEQGPADRAGNNK